MRSNSRNFRNINLEASGVSAVGLFVACCMLVITLIVGTVAYQTGLKAGQYDAAHDSWNNGYTACRIDRGELN